MAYIHSQRTTFGVPLMTATATTRRRRVNPVRCECQAHGRLIYPCEILPAGLPVRVTINRTDANKC